MLLLLAVFLLLLLPFLLLLRLLVLTLPDSAVGRLARKFT
jgi:hypothetical protein